MHVAIGGAIRRLGSVVIRSTFGVRMRVLSAPYAGYAPGAYTTCNSCVLVHVEFVQSENTCILMLIKC